MFNIQKVFLFLFLVLMSPTLFAQKTSVYASLNPGLFKFSGANTTRTSSFNPQSYTNEPYGSVLSPSFGFAVGINRTNSYHFLAGVEAGYDVQRSTVKINEIYDALGYAHKASGSMHINQNFLNVFPYGGYRFRANQVLIDAVLGLDIAYGFRLMESGRAVTDKGHTYLTRVSHGQMGDFRPRVQLGASYQYYMVTLSYAHGLLPYDEGMVGVAQTGAYARVWRLGLIFKFHVGAPS